MASLSVVETFIASLQSAERSHDVKDLIKLFREDAKCVSSTGYLPQPVSASAFWHRYLSAFEMISSEFVNILDDGKLAILEWKSKGTLAMGLPVEYCGVSILEYEKEKIKKFRTYYDSAALLPNAERSMKHYSESVGVPEISVEISS